MRGRVPSCSKHAMRQHELVFLPSLLVLDVFDRPVVELNIDIVIGQNKIFFFEQLVFDLQARLALLL